MNLTPLNPTTYFCPCGRTKRGTCSLCDRPQLRIVPADFWDTDEIDWRDVWTLTAAILFLGVLLFFAI